MEFTRKLVLEDGAEYYGTGFGYGGDAVCEIVFNTSMVGYLAASATSTLPVVLTVVALVCLALRQFAGSKLPAVVNDVLLVAANICLIGSFAVFVLARVSLAADVYFIPVNYPASEATALHISIVGAVCYLVGIVTLIVEGFSAKN